MTYQLEGLPKGYPIGWADAPEVFDDGEEFRHCSVQGCPDRPRFEICHGPWVDDEVDVPEGIAHGWWYVCQGHKDWLVANSEISLGVPVEREEV